MWGLLITEHDLWTLHLSPFEVVHFSFLLYLWRWVLGGAGLWLWRLVVLELLVHLGDLHLQFLQLGIDGQDRVENRFVQIH